MYSSRFSAWFCNDRLGMGCRIWNWAFIPFFIVCYGFQPCSFVFYFIFFEVFLSCFIFLYSAQI